MTYTISKGFDSYDLHIGEGVFYNICDSFKTLDTAVAEAIRLLKKWQRVNRGKGEYKVLMFNDFGKEYTVLATL